MKFLGTGAGEGTPNPFCSCRVCNNARKVGGRENRTRSSFRLDEKVLIDMGADYFAQAMNRHESFEELEHVMFTHTHDDHFNYTFLWERLVRTAGRNFPIHVYFSEQGYEVMEDFYKTSKVIGNPAPMLRENNSVLHKLAFDTPYEIGGWDVRIYRGRHNTPYESNTANYLCKKDGHSLYYALDSGYFLDETIEKLAGEALDIFIGECTVCDPKRDIMPNFLCHMDIGHCLQNLDRLYANGAITEKTQVYLTHFAPWATHEELCDFFGSLDRPYKVTPAYDGLEINF